MVASKGESGCVVGGACESVLGALGDLRRIESLRADVHVIEGTLQLAELELSEVFGEFAGSKGCEQFVEESTSELELLSFGVDSVAGNGGDRRVGQRGLREDDGRHDVRKAFCV